MVANSISSLHKREEERLKCWMTVVPHLEATATQMGLVLSGNDFRSHEDFRDQLLARIVEELCNSEEQPC